MFEPVNRNPSPADLRKFGWVMLIGLGVLGLVFLLAGRLSGRPAVPLVGVSFTAFAAALWVIGAIVWIISRVTQSGTRIVYVGWMTVTRPIGISVAVVGMTLLFFLFLPFFSLIVRRSDPLRRRRSAADSYWEEVRPFEPTVERMARLF